MTSSLAGPALVESASCAFFPPDFYRASESSLLYCFSSCLPPSLLSKDYFGFPLRVLMIVEALSFVFPFQHHGSYLFYL